MDKKKIFIFDMDGVIIDSVDSLLGLYGDFLSKFKIKNDPEDLKRVNGMNIKEIANFMKGKYNLKEDEQVLEKEYDLEMKKRYESVHLTNGLKEVLNFLHEKYDICLASSSKRSNILFILEKFEIKKYFSMIVSGDDVVMAKPSPEIYLKIMQEHGDQDYYVIEDSFNGLKAAKLAGAKTIFYNPGKKEVKENVDFSVRDMKDIKNLVIEIETGVQIVAPINRVNFNHKEHKIMINEEDKKVIEKVWKDQLEKRPNFFNGEIISYLSHKIENGEVILDYFFTEYKLFLTQFLKKAHLKIYPIAVNGITYYKNKFIIAKRKGTTEYDGYWEFVPSGGINSKNVREKCPYKAQVKEELFEEIGVKIKEENVRPFYLLFDKKHELCNIGCLIELNFEPDVKQLKINEYSELKILEKKEVKQFIKNNKFVPISEVLFELLK